MSTTVVQYPELKMPILNQVKCTNPKKSEIIRKNRFIRVVEFQKFINQNTPDDIFNEFIRLTRLVFGVSYNEQIKYHMKLYNDGIRVDNIEPGMSLQNITIIIPCTCDNTHSGVNCYIIEFLLGKGCVDCITRNSITEIFITRAESIHNVDVELYNYSKVNYRGTKEPVVIICIMCNKDFKQTPGKHLYGQGCPYCAHNRAGLSNRNTLEDFIRISREKHGDHYCYDNVEYETNKSIIKIYCNVCEKHFNQRAADHMSGCGCDICGIQKRSDSKRLTLDSFIKRARSIHGDKYCYDDVEYIRYDQHVLIFCNTCKEHFLQVPASHCHNKSGCPKCALKTIGNRDGHPSTRMIPMRFYYVKLTLEQINDTILTLYKVGVTKLTISERFRSSQRKNLNVKILYEEIFEPGYKAYEKEQLILNNPTYEEFKYNGNTMIRDGSGECFSHDILELDY